MEMLSQVIGKGSAGSGSPKAWTELVLKRERQLGFKAGNAPGLQKNDASTAPPPRPQTPAPNKAGNAPMNGASAQRMAPPRPATPSASAAASKRPPTPGSRVPRSSLLQTQSSFPNPGPPPPFSPTSPPGTRSGMSPAMRHSQMMAPSHVDAHMRAMQARHQKTKSMMF
ncbi:hypothetical protein KEM55_002009 [Ascosphaera atra]|nr:hypothetical protein KEM55_002009 [Ascosphaera atra]